MFIVGQINKEDIAGPKVLEHIVDCVLYMEDPYNQYRIMRSIKIGSVLLMK